MLRPVSQTETIRPDARRHHVRWCWPCPLPASTTISQVADAQRFRDAPPTRPDGVSMSRRDLIDPESPSRSTPCSRPCPGFQRHPRHRRTPGGRPADVRDASVPENLTSPRRTGPSPARTATRTSPFGSTGRSTPRTRCPGIYFIHGGGMVLGDIAGEDARPRCCARRSAPSSSRSSTGSPPSTPHPAPVEDCYAGLRLDGGRTPPSSDRPRPAGLYGGSAGGGLTLGTALLARDRGGPACGS